jgi:hypothetical protein
VQYDPISYQPRTQGTDAAVERIQIPEILAITKFDHPPYSSDLAPCDFWLFLKLKNTLKGQRFADISDIQNNMTENDFQDQFRQWHHRLTMCITSQGEYFEGDSRL